MITNVMEYEKLSPERYFEKLVCISYSTEEGDIIYWEPEYGGLRGRFIECDNNWPES